MTITKDFILSVSVNDAAVKNGADLVKKKQFIKLYTDQDRTFLSGECAGSGKNPYVCSADFVNESSPVFRCTCPSRQIPCKHVLGLLWAYMDGAAFITAEIPEDILLKRENKEKRLIQAKEKLAAVENSALKEKSAAWKKSAVKKIDAQLTGIGEAEKVLHSMVQSGLGALDAKSTHMYAGVIKQLDSYFISGIQNELNELLGMSHDNAVKGQKEPVDYAQITEKLCRIHTLLSKSSAYLEKKKEKPDVMDIESEIEERIGYAWKLEELAQYGLVETDASLVELCFHVRQEEDKQQFVDEGFYISLDSGKIGKTRNYRPFKAVMYIKEEDSVFSVLKIPKLYIYPSQSMNPRIRWNDYTLDAFEMSSPDVYKKIKSHAHPNLAEVIKTVKNQLKNLLLFPHPVMLVQFARIARLQDSEADVYVMYDASGNAICLRQSDYCQTNFLFLLDKLKQTETENNVMLLLFDNDVASGILSAQPLSLITDEKIIRLLF